MESNEIEIVKYGASKDLNFKTSIIDEKLKSDEIIIDVHYSGINFADVVMRLGMYKDAPPKPFTPGYEVSGIVLKVGSKVSNFKVGDRVMAGTRFGGYTSKLKVPSWQVIKLNQNLNLQEGASVPVNFITAHIALHEFGRIRANDKILIDCATGGVGVFCIQMAKNVGAQVIGLTSSADKKDFINELGAIAFTHDEFEASNEKDFDFILNSRGGSSIKKQYRLLSKSGKLCCIGLQEAIRDGKSNIFLKLKSVFSTPIYPLLMLVMNSKSVGGFNALDYFEDQEWMMKNLKIMENSQCKPHVGAVFDASEVGLAHEFLEQRKARGKVLLKWQ